MDHVLFSPDPFLVSAPHPHPSSNAHLVPLATMFPATPPWPPPPHPPLPPSHLNSSPSAYALLPPTPSHSHSHAPTPLLSRRSLLTASAPLSLLPIPIPLASADPTDPAVTDRVFLDFSICPNYFRSDRPLGADLAACPDPEPLGRVVLGLYGKLLPITVSNFKAMCASVAYRGALVHKVLQGQYFSAGRQGRRDRGEIRPPPGLARNTETVDPKAFQLRHVKPGTLSLCLSENDDYESVRMDPEYRNVEFLVTTGPGPCPQLDNENVVFGTVLEGLDVVTTIASIPTYIPSERIRRFNDLAEFLGDERAQNARGMWNRPLKTVYISDCGELKVVKPSLSPSLP